MSLIYETAPGVSSFVAQDDAESVGDAANRLARFVPEAVSDGIVVVAFGRTSPRVSELIAKLNEVPLAKSKYHSLAGILETKESAGCCGADLLSAIDHD